MCKMLTSMQGYFQSKLVVISKLPAKAFASSVGTARR